MILSVIIAFLFLVPDSTIVSATTDNGKLLSDFTLSRRTLDRFRRNNPSNKICWDRHPDKDSFFSVIDTHNHFRPFGGPPVPFDTYFQWMQDAGILFSTMFGIGQKIKKKHQTAPDCCYYLHCPTFDHLVVPTDENDRENAKDYVKYQKNANQTSKIHLILSATFPNLQRPGNISKNIESITNDFPGAFKWAGEINVIKHALTGNGFFKKDTSPRLTKSFIDNGNLDPFFKDMESKGWPVTLHTDIGCDNYNAFPKGALDKNPIKECTVPAKEMRLAAQNHEFWKDLLGDFYPAFFNTSRINQFQINDKPKIDTFKKIQHLQLVDTILSRYPKMKFVWPHMGLSKELRNLHPRIHSHIMEHFFLKYENLFVDASWDILAKLILLNFDHTAKVEDLSHKNHPDIFAETVLWNNTHINKVEAIRNTLHEKWEEIKATVHTTGSKQKLNGPTYAFVIYLELFEKYPERFLTGTDFVSSMGEPDKYPGLKEFKFPPSGCMKDEANHKRQVTDNSALNIFLNDNAFRKIVLGENYFKLTGLDSEFAAPQVCNHDGSDSNISHVHSHVFTHSGASSLSTPIMIWILKWVMDFLFCASRM